MPVLTEPKIQYTMTEVVELIHASVNAHANPNQAPVSMAHVSRVLDVLGLELSKTFMVMRRQDGSQQIFNPLMDAIMLAGAQAAKQLAASTPKASLLE